MSKTSGAADKSKNRLKKQSKKLDEERTKARNDAEIEISMDNVLEPTEPRAKPAPLVAPTTPSDDGSDGNNSEVEEQETLLSAKQSGGKNRQVAFQQRDLVALAFAGDNVVQVYSKLSISYMLAFSKAHDSNLRKSNAAKWLKTRLRKWILRFLAG